MYEWKGKHKRKWKTLLLSPYSLRASMQMAQNGCYALSPVEQKELKVSSGAHAGAEWVVMPFISLLSVWIFTQGLCTAPLYIQNAEVGGSETLMHRCAVQVLKPVLSF